MSNLRSVVLLIVVAASRILAGNGAADAETNNRDLKLVFACAADNDLYRVMTAAGGLYPRYASAAEAVRQAPAGAGLLILADGYPRKTTSIAPAVFDQAARKDLRLYVEYPAALPDMTVGPPRRTQLERVVVSADVFGASLKKMQLLALHECHFVEVQAERPFLVAAKVAGFDTAVYGLDDVQAWPILFQHPRAAILVSTTKLSQFVTARYATQDAMQEVWKMVLGRLQPGAAIPALCWTPTVRPTYTRQARLPADAVRRAIVRGIDWHTRAKLLLDAEFQDRYVEDREACLIRRAPLGTSKPTNERSAGDGRFGVLEGFSSQINYLGQQPIRWWLRTDSNGESALAFALRSKIDGDQRSRRIAANLSDWVYFNSPFFQKDPAKSNFGLIYWGTGTPSLCGDNDIKSILGCLGTAAVLESDRWDEVLVQNILGNFRTTGVYGFRGAALDNRELLAKGWQHFWRSTDTHFAPHYQAWIWASYLWLYGKTHDRLLLDRTGSAIAMMMDAYPDRWR